MNYGIYDKHSAAQQNLAAKMSLEQSAAYVSTDEPRQHIMGAVSRIVEGQGNRICEVLSSVSLFLDRVFGPQPEDCATPDVAPPQRSGMFHEVDRNLSRNDYLLTELEQKIRRLSDIA